MTIAVVGVGFVGLVTAAVFAKFGNTIWAINRDKAKSEALQRGQPPFYEPGLDTLVKENVAAGRLQFTTSYKDAITDADVVMIAVGTPSAPDGTADLTAVMQAAASLAPYLKTAAIVIVKSTVPPGTNSKVADVIKQQTKKNFYVASVPEFLREGTAVEDTLHPDRIVLGADEPTVIKRLLELHRPLDSEIIVMKPESAQLTKYAANAYLANRIVFVNQIADLAEKTNADVGEIIRGMGLDRRIGLHYWWPGLQYGGSCFDANTTTYLLNSPHVTAMPISAHLDTEGSSNKAMPLLALTDRRSLSFDSIKQRSILAGVTAMTKRRYRGQMVTLSARMGRNLRVTADHPVVVINRIGERKIKPASDVIVGDKLILATKISGLVNESTINLLDYLLDQPNIDASKIKVRTDDNRIASSALRFVKYIPSALFPFPYQIRNTNCLPIRVYRYLRDSKLINISPRRLYLFTAKGNPTYFPAALPLSPKVIRLLGYYIAEGWISQDQGRKGAVRQRVGFALHVKETEYQNDILTALRSLNIRYLTKSCGNTWSVIISSSPFAILLRDYLGCGINSHSKRLPKIIFNVSHKLKMEFLRGAMSGDGSITPIQSGKNVMLEYATTSKALADGMALLLQSMGIIASIRRRWLTKSKHLAYILRISGVNQIARLKDVFGKKKGEKLYRLISGYRRQIKQSGFQMHKYFATIDITSIQKEKVEENVYSIETDTGLLLMNSGIVVHNCFPKDVKELAAYARRVNEGDGLFEKIDALNEARLPKMLKKFQAAVGGWEGKTIAVLGAAFKPNTDDLREAPSLKVIPMIVHGGARVNIYDPQANANAKRILGDQVSVYADSPYDAATDAHAVIILVEWDEFKSLDLERLKSLMRPQPVFIDTRNLYSRERLAAAGFHYIGIGR